MIQRAGGTLNEAIAESRPRPTLRWLTTANWLGATPGGLTVVAPPPQLFESPPEQAGLAVSPSLELARRRRLVNSNMVFDALAGSGTYTVGSYSLASPVRKAFDVDIPRTEGASITLRQIAPPLFPTSIETIGARSSGLSISGALHEKHKSLVPFLALVRSALERDDFDAARRALDAVPLDASDEGEVRRLKTLLAPPRITVSRTRDVDRSREYQWFRNHWHNYRGQWVAVDGNNVLASARSLRELREMLKALNLARPPVVHRVD